MLTIAQELAKNSIPTYYQQVVGDNEERMYEAIELAASRSELIIYLEVLDQRQMILRNKYWRDF